jgi:hypothetical protein
MKLEEKLKIIKQASQLEETELGEWWHVLCDMHPRVMDGASDEFREAWEKEIDLEFERVTSEFKIVERTETITRTYKELVWIYDL